MSTIFCNCLSSLWIPSSTNALIQAEGKLLSRCDAQISNVPIDFRDMEDISIRTLEKESVEDNEDVPLVLCHGYGSGIGGWYRNINGLTQKYHIYAFDWLGFGNSSRPENGPKGLGIEGTESWFIESLEEWRKKQGLEKFHLCGHSLGGYLAVCYAEKYPNRLKSLILESPVGVPDTKDRPDIHQIIASMPFPRKQLFSTVNNLWENGSTPGGVLRKFGPLGKPLMGGYVHRRFEDDVEKDNFAEYLYHNAASTKISGELALNELLTVGAWARKPLHSRVLKLDPKIPIDFIYGSHDWMDHRHAIRVKEDPSKNPKQKINVHVVQSAGHYIHLDQPEIFDSTVLNIVQRKVKSSPFSDFA